MKSIRHFHMLRAFYIVTTSSQLTLTQRTNYLSFRCEKKKKKCMQYQTVVIVGKTGHERSVQIEKYFPQLWKLYRDLLYSKVKLQFQFGASGM